MRLVGTIIINLILLSIMFGLFVYGIVLMGSFVWTMFYRKIDVHDLKLYYEGFIYIMISVCMWMSVTEKPVEVFEEDYVPDVRTPEEFYAKYEKMPEAILSL